MAADDRDTSENSTLPPPSLNGAIGPHRSGFEWNTGHSSHRHEGGAKEEGKHVMHHEFASTAAPTAQPGGRSNSKNSSEGSVNCPHAKLDASYEEIHTEEDQFTRPVLNGVGRFRGNSYDDEKFDEDEYNSEDEEDEEDEDVPRIAMIAEPSKKRFSCNIFDAKARAGKAPLEPSHNRYREEEQPQHSTEWRRRGCSFSDAEHEAWGPQHANGEEWKGVFSQKAAARIRMEGHPRHVYIDPPSLPERLSGEVAKVVTLSPLRRRSPLAYETVQAASENAVKAHVVGEAHKFYASEPFAARRDWTPTRGEFEPDDAGVGVGIDAVVPLQQRPRRSDPSEWPSGGDANVVSALFSEEKPQERERGHESPSLQKKYRRHRKEEKQDADSKLLQRSASPSTDSEAEVREKKKHRRMRSSGGDDDDEKPRSKSRRKLKKRHGNDEKKTAGEGENGNEAEHADVQVLPVFTAEQVVPPKPKKTKIYCNSWFSMKRKKKQREASAVSAKQAAVKQPTDTKGGASAGMPSVLEKGQHATQTPAPHLRRQKHQKRRPSPLSSEVSDDTSAACDHPAAAALVPRSQSLEHHHRRETSKSPAERGSAKKRVNNLSDVD
ncbi:hypothetical protein TraAM80_04039 [Trypanosoma rangeli]|uniref:Uncharacterized protein n=1 Tax=Trypanosoma rangeli TaxID=5698 RepID=A0A422NLK1_TRYRA|nr:uncharacterized protein TraAM80_04039 [Trypanosoma rangeli]RNF06341.1 hypothetical protein TraAM80_04039 [Trypanosoma rangeli]|eukprot:RNF06341.1 hypothetical protein TraAM80_04039 [Trypanosoma rangeli]